MFLFVFIGVGLKYKIETTFNMYFRRGFQTLPFSPAYPLPITTCFKTVDMHEKPPIQREKTFNKI